MPSRRASLLLLPVIYLGFISLGLPDGTLGVAWPPMHKALGLPVGLAGTMLLIVTSLSAISSFSSGWILGRFRTGPVVLVSCALTGSALLIVGRAENLAWLLCAAAPLGFGAGAVDAGLNGYVARHYSGRHMNWLHACWGIGATCGPLLMTRALASPDGWRAGYTTIGLLQLSLAAVFLATLRLWSPAPERAAAAAAAGPAGAEPVTSANSEAGWLSVAIFAIYVAIETSAGLWAATVLVESRGVDLRAAGLCTTAYYGSITGGRILVGFFSDRWGNRRTVRAGLVLALAAATAFVFARSAPVAALALVFLGLGFAPVYPGLMHEVPRRFAARAVFTVIGRQSGGAYLGAIVLFAVSGWIASNLSLESIPWIVAGGVVALGLAVWRLDRIT